MNNLLDKILKRYYENNVTNNSADNIDNQNNNIKLEIQEIKDMPYVIQKQELQVFKEKAELIELSESNKDDSLTNVKNLLKIIKVKTYEQQDSAINEEEKEIAKENTTEITENNNVENITNESNDYITNFEDLVIEILKESLFTNYAEDYVFEVWFSNIRDIINEMKQYELVPTNIKVRKDKIKFLTTALQESSAIISENYLVFEDYMQELIDDIKFEAGEELTNDLIHTINTNMLVPLSLVFIDNIKTEEAEILYEALKSNILNLLTVFTSKYLTQQYIN